MKTILSTLFILAIGISFGQEKRTEPVVVEEERIEIPEPPAPRVEEYEKPRLLQERIVDFPNVEATFPGGTDEMMKYIQHNITYPAASLEANDQGKVYVKFVVDATGKIKNVSIERGVSPDLDREAKRVVRSMPKWTPAEMGDHKFVSSYVRIPFVFTIPAEQK